MYYINVSGVTLPKLTAPPVMEQVEEIAALVVMFVVLSA